MLMVLADSANPYGDPYVRCPFCRNALKGEMNCLEIKVKGIRLAVCPSCETEFKASVAENRHSWGN